MKLRVMTKEQGERVGISHFPNFHRTGSVRGMKRLYYGADAMLVRCRNFLIFKCLLTIKKHSRLPPAVFFKRKIQ